MALIETCLCPAAWHSLGLRAVSEAAACAPPPPQAHQVDQQRIETDAKDSALVKEHMERQKVEQEKDSLTAETLTMRDQMVAAQSSMASLKAEMARLTEMLHNAELVSSCCELRTHANWGPSRGAWPGCNCGLGA